MMININNIISNTKYRCLLSKIAKNRKRIKKYIKIEGKNYAKFMKNYNKYLELRMIKRRYRVKYRI